MPQTAVKGRLNLVQVRKVAERPVVSLVVRFVTPGLNAIFSATSVLETL